MIDDGDIDYRGRSAEQLRESGLNIDRARYPKNLRNLLAEMAARGITDPITEPVSPKVSEKRSSASILIEFARNSYCTSSLCIALIVVFALEFRSRGAGSGIQNSVAAAGLVKFKVIQGEWWRLLTGPLLHVNVQHIYYNIFALFLFGGIIERLASRPILPLVVLLSALSGSVASLLFLPHTTTVGISGAVMGVMGFYLAYQLTRSPRLPPKAFAWVGLNIGINLLFGAIAHVAIDNAAHVGGLLMGVALGLIFLSQHRKEAKTPIRLPLIVQVLGILSAAVLIGGCAFTIFRLVNA